MDVGPMALCEVGTMNDDQRITRISGAPARLFSGMAGGAAVNPARPSRAGIRLEVIDDAEPN